jgi:hypothetical protein
VLGDELRQRRHAHSIRVGGEDGAAEEDGSEPGTRELYSDHFIAIILIVLVISVIIYIHHFAFLYIFNVISSKAQFECTSIISLCVFKQFGIVFQPK